MNTNNYKKNTSYLLAILVLITQSIAAQSTSENYVKSTVYKIATRDTTAVDSLTMQTIDYYDGLGRSKQSIAVAAGGRGEDIVTHFEYDQFGRQVKTYLPYPAPSLHGDIHRNVLDSLNAFYLDRFFNELDVSKPNPYSEVTMEASPLGRITQQGAPGSVWGIKPNNDNDHTIKYVYGSNDSSEVRRFKVVFADPTNTEVPSLTEDGHYQRAVLYKNITKDENWQSSQFYINDHTSEEYTDLHGRVVLKRTYDQEPHDTYYVYDIFGNLTYVLPPLASENDNIDSEILNTLCYQYRYDHRNRLVEKKLPGKGWEYIVYNALDQPILTQDALLRGQGQWLFTKYDALGRTAYTGVTSLNSSREEVQAVANASITKLHEVRTSTFSDTSQGVFLYYTNDSFPKDSLQYHTIQYYDDYQFDTGTLRYTQPVYGVTPTDAVKGLPAGSKTRVLKTDQWITTVINYDEKGRIIHTGTQNEFLNTTETHMHELDFLGHIQQTQTAHFGPQDGVVTSDHFTYDHHNRLLRHAKKVGTNTEELIAEHVYDELGQPVTKKVGGKAVNDGLQHIDHTYNIRGWLRGINEVNTLGQDLFAMNIDYDTTDSSDSNLVPLYNGNINRIKWKTANDHQERWYRYKYDALNRLKDAEDNAHRYSEFAWYDKNGNIQGITRLGTTDTEHTAFGVMDLLSYTYNGNQLTSVSDGTNIDNGFKDGNTMGDDYTYDVNGNMISDANKGITNIEYNHLNLPTKISFDGVLRHINYIYAANGTKLKKVVRDGQTLKSTLYADNFIYEGIPNAERLQFFFQPEGYVEVLPTIDGDVDYKYVYQYRDHLGNNRLSYSDANGDGSIATEPTQLAEHIPVVDEGFESASGWDSMGAPEGIDDSVTSYDTNLKKTGDRSAYLEVPQGWGSYKVRSNEYVPLDHNETVEYIFSAWVYNDSPRAVVFLFQNREGETHNFSKYDYLTTTERGRWVYLEKRVVSPPDMVNFNLRLDVWGSGNKAWFDEVKVTRVETHTIDSEIVEENNYYPFGLKHQGYNSTIVGRDHTFEYNGMEFEQALDYNMQEMELRHYDPAIARWVVHDPVTHFSNSTYNGYDNNPVLFSDPSGADVIETSYGTTYTGADAQSMFRSLQAQYDGETECHDCKDGQTREQTRYGYPTMPSYKVTQYYNARDKIWQSESAYYESWRSTIRSIGQGITSIESLGDYNLTDEALLGLSAWAIQARDYYGGRLRKASGNLEENNILFDILAFKGPLTTMGKLITRARTSRFAFWSGRVNGVSAREFAKKAGYEVISETNAGVSLNKLTSSMDYHVGSKAWEYWGRLSQVLARSIPRGSTVNVYVTRGANANPMSIWSRFERPILEANKVKIKYNWLD